MWWLSFSLKHLYLAKYNYFSSQAEILVCMNVSELYSQLTLNDRVTARPPTIVRETFNPSSL